MVRGVVPAASSTRAANSSLSARLGSAGVRGFGVTGLQLEPKPAPLSVPCQLQSSHSQNMLQQYFVDTSSAQLRTAGHKLTTYLSTCLCPKQVSPPSWLLFEWPRFGVHTTESSSTPRSCLKAWQLMVIVIGTTQLLATVSIEMLHRTTSSLL